MSAIRLTLVTPLLLATLAGCSDDPDPAAPSSSGAVPISEVTPDSAPDAVATTLADHVPDVAAFPGFAAGVVEEQDLQAFARAHDKTVAELRASGLVRAATLMLEPKGRGDGFAMAIAAVYATPEQAEAEAARLFAANSEPEPGATIEPLDVSTVPGALAVRLSGREGGEVFTGLEVVFVEGDVLHEVFAIGTGDLVSVDAVLAEVTALSERVTGRALAG